MNGMACTGVCKKQGRDVILSLLFYRISFLWQGFGRTPAARPGGGQDMKPDVTRMSKTKENGRG
jgi:hypothetical protein